jgi:glucose-1-phosphate thymidylyltransferase
VTLTKAVVLAQVHDSGQRVSARFPRACLPPAPLLPVANRALLGHALDWLAQGGIREATVIVPHGLAGQAQDAVASGRVTPSLSWVEELPDESLAHVLSDLSGFLAGEPFVLHLSDSLAKQGLRSLTGGRARCDTEALLVMDESREVELAQVVRLRAAASGGSARPRPLHNESAGVAVMGAAAVEAVADLDLDHEHVLEALADRLEQRGGRIDTCGVTDWWRYRGGTDALLEGNRFALEGTRAHYDPSQPANSKIQGAVIVHPEAMIEASVVRGPTIIGARARVRDAYVGPYTSIGDDVVVEGAEIEHSVVLPGASISHLGGRLEESVIGPKSRVFRDFRLPRALRLTVGEGAEVCLT